MESLMEREVVGVAERHSDVELLRLTRALKDKETDTLFESVAQLEGVVDHVPSAVITVGVTEPDACDDSLATSDVGMGVKELVTQMLAEPLQL